MRRTLKNGTTTACYFATIHTDASLLLAEIADKFGQRAFVGKVCMDLNDSVPEYKETTEESVRETKRFVSEMLEKKYPRVKPIVTPRFALSCSETLMGELGSIAKNNGLHIQPESVILLEDEDAPTALAEAEELETDDGRLSGALSRRALCSAASLCCRRGS